MPPVEMSVCSWKETQRLPRLRSSRKQTVLLLPATRRSQDICICPGSILGPAAGPQRSVSSPEHQLPRPAPSAAPTHDCCPSTYGSWAARDTQEKNKALDTRMSEAGILEDPMSVYSGCGQAWGVLSWLKCPRHWVQWPHVLSATAAPVCLAVLGSPTPPLISKEGVRGCYLGSEIGQDRK